jgi:hypothetical protein
MNFPMAQQTQRVTWIFVIDMMCLIQKIKESRNDSLFVFYTIYVNRIENNDMAKKPTQVAQDVVEIPVTIDFKVTKHFIKRLNGRNLTQDSIIQVVKEVLPSVITKNANKKNDTIDFSVCDKQSCIVAVVQLVKHNNNILSQSAIVKTSYIFDGKNGPLPNNTVFINEDNPSPEFEEALQNVEWYGDTWSNGGNASGAPQDFVDKNYDAYGNPTSYKGYVKYKDPERQQITQMVDKKKRIAKQQQMRKMYADRQNNYSDKQKEQDIEWLWKGKSKWDNKFKDWAFHDTNNALKRADSEILTPYGPNGSLRGIDRKRKKLAAQRNAQQESINRDKILNLTENDLKYIIQECIKRIL